MSKRISSLLFKELLSSLDDSSKNATIINSYIVLLEQIEFKILHAYYDSLNKKKDSLDDNEEEDINLRGQVMTLVLEIKNNCNLLRMIAELTDI